MQTGRLEEVKEVYREYAEAHAYAITGIIGGPSSKTANTLLELEQKHGLTGVSDLIAELGRMALFEAGRPDRAIYAFRVLVEREPEKVGMVIKYLEEYREEK